jgi:carbamoyltransferase
MYILGISAFYHDSAAALIKNGQIIAAAQEERFTRIKNDESFPINSIKYCLKEADIQINDLEYIAFYEDTHLKFNRIINSYIRYIPKSIWSLKKALSLWLGEKIYAENKIYEFLEYKGKTSYVLHHVSHAASAFYPSNFEKAAILVIDGVGEWASTSIGIGDGNQVKLIQEIKYPHSLGMLYSAFTQYAGFRVNSGEYKLMGLAPYGEAIYCQKILDHLIDLKDDGSYHLNLKYFDFHHGKSTINSQFEKLFDAPARVPESEIRKIDQDMAASIQVVFNEIILRLAKTAKKISNATNLVIAGGVGLNCVANGFIASKRIFENIWVQPAANDSGGALGCALYVYYNKMASKRELGITDQGASLFGPSFDDNESRHYLEMFGIKYQEFENKKELDDNIIKYLMEEKVVGLFQGRMEFGPRSLGSRSIIGDPRSEKMQRTMNLRVKYRESFRPFAPAVMKEHASEYFDIDYHSPYMQFVVPVKKDKRLSVDDTHIEGIDKLYQKRSTLPAITHVDYSARVQIVDKKENPRFYEILECFYENTGCPVLINTSFNVRGEPIICTPEDALECFFSNEIDVLILNNFLIFKDGQNYEKIGLMYRKPDHVKMGERCTY